MERIIPCCECRRDLPESAYWPKTLAKPGRPRCRECIGAWVSQKIAGPRCECDACRTWRGSPPMERARLWAIREIQDSGSQASPAMPLLKIAGEFARLRGVEAPGCNGQAWELLSLAYRGLL